jgi:hypothetical protein
MKGDTQVIDFLNTALRHELAEMTSTRCITACSTIEATRASPDVAS